MEKDKIIKLTEAIKLNPLDADSFINRGNVLYDFGRKEEAIKDYNKAIEINPQYADAFYNRGVIQDDLGRKEEAIKDYNKAIEINPQYANAFYNRGNVLYDFGRKEEAIKDYNKAIEINPLDANAFNNRGTVLSGLGRKEEAIKDYNKAIEINPQYANAFYNRGVIQDDLGRKEEAIKDYNKAIEINPQYANAFYNRGSVLSGLGRKEEAIKDYNKAIEINPQYANAFYNRGSVLNDLGRKEEAIKDYNKAIEIDPQYAKAFYNRGVIQDDLGRKEEAIKDYNKAIEINPQYADAFYNRGAVLSDLGRKEEAFTDFLSAYEIKPQDPLYNIQLGVSLLQKDDKQKAHEFLVKGQKLIQSLSQDDKKKYNLSEGNIRYINEKVKLIQQIEQELQKLNSLIKSKTLSESQQKILQEQIQPIEAKFKQQINQQINKDDNNETNENYKLILKQLNEIQQNYQILNQKVISMENQTHQIIIKQMYELKQDENRYIYYQSLYWRLYNYLSACQQLSTDLFKKNTDAVIDNDQERVAQIISKVVQQISNQAGSIPIVGTVITIISSALEFGFSYHIDYKFNKIVMNLTQIVQERCDSRNHIDEQIQLAIIKQSKQLRELTQDQEIEQQRLLKHVKEIQMAERENGNRLAENPYWMQGIVDTLRILRNLLLNNKQIQQDKKKELHIVILESLKYDDFPIDSHQVVNNSRSCCERCQNSCQIQ